MKKLDEHVFTWMDELLDGSKKYKSQLLNITHPNLWASNQWEDIRKRILLLGGVDDPTARNSRLSIEPILCDNGMGF